MTTHPPQLSRRALLGAGISAAAVLALSACTTTNSRFITPTSTAVSAAEGARAATGKTVAINLQAAPTTLDLAGSAANTWAYGSTPAPVIRATQGDTILVNLSNQLPDPTTIHWHGVALRNDMDGVPQLTQSPVNAGDAFSYQFRAPQPGTYWFHPHVGTQQDRGLYGALIIDDPKEPLSYDSEWVIILDDWLDGVTATPDAVLAELSKGMTPMAGMMMRQGNLLMGTNSDLLKGDAGDVYYPHYLINGKPAEDPETFTAKPGDRIRLRIINAGSDTAFRVALGSHRLTLTHTDGYPVTPMNVDSVLIGMGERYDAIVTVGDGVFPLIAEAEGKSARAFALLRTAPGNAPTPSVGMPELNQLVGTADKLTAAAAVTLAAKKPDREFTVRLTGGMGSYDWGLNGQRFDAADPTKNAFTVGEGERVRINFVNTTTMWHPMHLHGHTYQHPDNGARKDTSIVYPGGALAVDLQADNPGQWLLHCHNLYHGSAGMMGTLAYTE